MKTILRLKDTTVKDVVSKIRQHEFLHTPYFLHPDLQDVNVGDSPVGKIAGMIENPHHSPEPVDFDELKGEECTWDFRDDQQNIFAWKTRGGYLLSLYESMDVEAPDDVFMHIEHESGKPAHESTMFVPNVLSAVFGK